MSRRNKNKAEQMFDVLASYPELSRDEIIEKIGLVDKDDFHHVKGVLQDLLGDSEDINLVARRDGPSEPWVYSLQGLPTHETVEFYHQNKGKDIFLRLRRFYMGARSIDKGVDQSTLEGRLSRLQRRAIWRALEDTHEVLVEYGVSGDLEMPQQ